MISLILLFTAALVIGVEFVCEELSQAPEGYQTDEGFHLTWKNNSPEVEDVSCVWTVQSPKPTA